MLAAAREIFDIITFYKPISSLAEEGKGIFESAAALFGVFALFTAVSLALRYAISPSNPAALFQAAVIPIASVFAFVLVQVPVASTAVFLVSRTFSSKTSLSEMVSLNYFLLACTSILMLVTIVPFAEFAGLVMLPFGLVIYTYFLEGLFEKLFGISSIQGLSLLVLYLLVTWVLLQSALYLSAIQTTPPALVGGFMGAVVSNGCQLKNTR